MELSDLVYIDSTGYHYADYPTFLEYFKQKYRDIYGADTYLEADSQDGQLVSVEAKAAFDTAALGANIYLSFSPSTAQDAGLSRVVKINGIRRRSPTYSTADLTIVGSAGTEILNGVAEDTISQKWLLPASVIIPPGGSIVVTATASEKGALAAVPNSINRIFTPTLGWQTVNNVLAATQGVPVEEDAELRVRQTTSTEIPSLTVFEGTIGAVANLDGVTRVRGYENDSGTTDADGIPAHSISIVAEGGVTQEIADAIAAKKTPGTRTYGTTSAITYDKYGVPNTINFYRPTVVPIKVEVTLTAYTGYSTSFGDMIKAAVAAEINKLAIGDDVLITKLFVPANLPGTFAGTTFNISTLKIAKVGNAFGTIDVPVLFNEAASCVVTDITIVVT